MFLIDKIEIDGFWGKFNISTSLSDGINIFIGKNGTGKTTFINMIQAVLSADVNMLDMMQYDEIRLSLKTEGSTRSIAVSKIKDDGYFDYCIRYRIGRNVFKIPLMANNIERRKTRMHPFVIERINQVKGELKSLVSLSWLSVYREIMETECFIDNAHRKAVAEVNSIDRRLEDLMRQLTTYQLQLESELAKISEQFRRDVLICMLYDPAFDRYDIKKEDKVVMEDVRQGLLHAYEYLSAIDEKVSKRIDLHCKRIEKSLEVVKQSDAMLDVNDVMPLSLLRRTQRIVELSTEMELKKRNLFNQIVLYISTLRRYAQDKSIDLDPGRDGDLLIKKDEKVLKLDDLSSGEKQLIILLTEVLLQKERRSIFIADEPELSLHIEWQREILASIKELNPKAQVIVATHSPEVAGKWRNNIIAMERITHAR